MLQRSISRVIGRGSTEIVWLSRLSVVDEGHLRPVHPPPGPSSCAASDAALDEDGAGVTHCVLLRPGFRGQGAARNSVTWVTCRRNVAAAADVLAGVGGCGRSGDALQCGG